MGTQRMMNKRVLALGRLPVGQMNKGEKEFSLYLESQRKDGHILSWRFEAFKLRLADNCFYTPDFVVLNSDRTLTLFEVKGYWISDAKTKIKVAAEQFPYLQFVAVYKRTKKDGGGWNFENF